DECHAMGLKIVPPDVNVGQFNFTVNDTGDIVYGLGAIKGLGEGPIEAIIAERQKKPFENLLDVCQRLDSQLVNRRSQEALIKSGAFDNLMEGGPDVVRAALLALLPASIQAAEQSKRNSESKVDDLFGDISPEAPAGETESPGASNQAWSEQERLQAEKSALGLYLSGHPIEEFLPELSKITRSRLSGLSPERGTQLVAGLLYGLRTMRTKTGDTIAFLMLDDRSARFELSLSARDFEKYRDQLQLDSIILAECTVSVDDYNDGMRGRAKQLMSLLEARKRFAKRLAVRLRSDELVPAFCDHLASILLPHCQASHAGSNLSNAPGVSKGSGSKSGDRLVDSGCRVIIDYRRADSRGSIMLGSEWFVSPTDELLQNLRREFGKDRIELAYSQNINLN
ncbi:MAG: DNA polymerase III subunit alpha, partial [Pseudomonadota bacterium]|nr:DNA polymerase III subunit alpha [Pseudomonadota bacterium]